MSDRQPLLNSSPKQLLDNDDRNNNENDKQFSTKNLFDWRRWLKSKEDNDDDDDDDDDNAVHIPNDTAVGIFKIFRFANRIDLLLMTLCMFLRLVTAVTTVGTAILFGQVTGLFAMESFGDNCSNQNQTLFDTIKNNITCPLGIELNPSNIVHLQKLCHHNEVILSSTVVVSMPSFHEKVMKIVYWLLIIGCVQYITLTLDYSIWAISIRRQITRMYIALFRSLIQRNITYFDTRSMSQFNAELFTNIETIMRGLGDDFVGLSSALISIVINLISCFIVNWTLTLIMLCIMPFVIGATIILTRVYSREMTEKFQKYSKIGQIVKEVFSSLRTVHSLNGSKYEQKRYEKNLTQIQWNDTRKGALLGIYIGWVFFLSCVVYSVGFIFGSLMSNGSKSIFNLSDIIIVVSVFASSMSYLSSIGPLFQSFLEAQTAAAPVFRLIDEEQNTHFNEPGICRENETTNATSMFDTNNDIEFDNANFSYPSRQDMSVLRNFSLIARTGQKTALVGSSGCGKSTCVSLILRQYDLSSGQIKIGNQSITNFNLKQLRQNIGVVSQEPILFSMSIYENIRLGKVNATRAEIEEAAREANAHNFIMQLPNKYETFVGERGIQLSGGEKQRIALARALVKQPSILLLDEATSALDNASEKIVQAALDQACKNRTTIVIAHRLSTIRNADHIYVLDNGSVLEEGTHDTLIAKEGGKYQALVKKQQVEKMDDDQDSIMNMEQALEEEQQFIRKRSRSFTDNKAIDINKESSTSSKQKSIFLRLWSMSRPEWIIIAIGCIICALIGIGQIVFAILLTDIINAFKHCSNVGRQHQVVFSSLMVLLLGIFLFIFRVLKFTVYAIAGLKLAHRVRIKAFECLLRQEIAYFDRPENNSSAINVRLSSDAAALEQMVGPRLGEICQALTMSIVGFLFGMFYSWQLTMIVTLTFLIVIITSCLHLQLSIYLSKQSTFALENANKFAVEIIHNMRTIKQLSVETEIIRQHTELVYKMHTMSYKLDWASSIILSFTLSLDPFVFGFLYWCALVLYEMNDLTANNIIMIFSFAIFATQSSKIIGMLCDRMAASLSAAQKFFDLFDRIPTIDNGSTEGRELINFRGDIEFDQVKFFYPTRPTSIVLKKLQLTIKSSQRVALVGTSGCGKSTIIQLLERFYDVTDGQLRLDGVDIRQLNLHWVRSKIGLVSQEPVLFDLTIAENITYGLENIPMDEIIDAATKANIHGFIQQLPQGYETRVGAKGCLVSGGEKQRIAIARVLLRRPKILLLDEATSALDLYNEQIVQLALEQAQTEDPSRTSLTIAHRLSTIRSSDLICVLDNGRIGESGTHTDLIQQRGYYYNMMAQHSS